MKIHFNSGAGIGNFTPNSALSFMHDADNTVGPLLPLLPGDYNDNGKVDAADYVLWRKGGPLKNEADTPGTVNAADYTAWRARFGNPSGAGSGSGLSATVPEPSTIALAFLGVLLCRAKSSKGQFA